MDICPFRSRANNVISYISPFHFPPGLVPSLYLRKTATPRKSHQINCVNLWWKLIPWFKFHLSKLKCFSRISFLSQSWIHREPNKIPAINIVLRPKKPLRTLVVQFDVESRQDEKVKQQTIIKSNLDAYLTQSVKKGLKFGPTIKQNTSKCLFLVHVSVSG